MIKLGEETYIIKKLPHSLNTGEYHLVRKRNIFSLFTEDIFIKNKFYTELLIK